MVARPQRWPTTARRSDPETAKLRLAKNPRTGRYRQGRSPTRQSAMSLALSEIQNTLRRACLCRPTIRRGVDVTRAECRFYVQGCASLLIRRSQLCETRSSHLRAQVGTLVPMIIIRPNHCSQGLLDQQRSDSRRSICAGRAADPPRGPATCGLTSRVSARTSRKRTCFRGAARRAH